MLEWIEVDDSRRVDAVAYDVDNESICVRFPGGVEWVYEACLPHIWEEFMAPTTSKGKYISDVLNHMPHHPYEG